MNRPLRAGHRAIYIGTDQGRGETHIILDIDSPTQTITTTSLNLNTSATHDPGHSWHGHFTDFITHFAPTPDQRQKRIPIN